MFRRASRLQINPDLLILLKTEISAMYGVVNKNHEFKLSPVVSISLVPKNAIPPLLTPFSECFPWL
jgi:hypothetical protein